jgi:hypothetical protein
MRFLGVIRKKALNETPKWAAEQPIFPRQMKYFYPQGIVLIL